MNMPTHSITMFARKLTAGKIELPSNRLAKTATKGEFIMSAHSFSVSNPPKGVVARTYSSRKEMAKTIDEAINFAFTNLGSWCLVGSYPIVGKGSKAKTQAYKSAWTYQSRLETTLASALEYEGATFPVEWNRQYNIKTKAYEVRIKVSYVHDLDYPSVNAEELDRVLASSSAKSIDQFKSLKQAVDEVMFGAQRTL